MTQPVTPASDVIYPRLLPPSRRRASRRWQFSLLSLFILQTIVAVILAVGYEVTLVTTLMCLSLSIFPLIATIFFWIRPLVGAVVCFATVLALCFSLYVVVFEYPELQPQLLGPGRAPAMSKSPPVPKKATAADWYFGLWFGLGTCLALGSGLGCALSAADRGDI